MTPSVGDVIGDSGSLPEITEGIKKWSIGKPTQRAKDALEGLIIAEATSEIIALKGLVDAVAYGELLADLRKAIGGRQYATWGPGWLEGIAGIDGNAKFLTALLRERHPEAILDDAKRLIDVKGDEVQLALAQTVPPFLVFLAQWLPVPAEKKAQFIAVLTEKLLSRLSQLVPPTTPTASS